VGEAAVTAAGRHVFSPLRSPTMGRRYLPLRSPTMGRRYLPRRSPRTAVPAVLTGTGG
jgi:hypothetical protein